MAVHWKSDSKREHDLWHDLWHHKQYGSKPDPILSRHQCDEATWNLQCTFSENVKYETSCARQIKYFYTQTFFMRRRNGCLFYCGNFTFCSPAKKHVGYTLEDLCAWKHLVTSPAFDSVTLWHHTMPTCQTRQASLAHKNRISAASLLLAGPARVCLSFFFFFPVLHNKKQR